MTNRDDGPKSDFCRYAYGWSDKKPDRSFWLMLGVLAALALSQCVEVV